MNEPSAQGTPEIRAATCPACGKHVAVPFYDGGEQCMATLAWPESDTEARRLPRYPLDFVACIECGHIYNARFEYVNVPYRDKPNLMYNRGSNWSQFLHELADELLNRVPPEGTVVEIGPANDVFFKPKHPYTEILIGSNPEPDPESERHRDSTHITGEIPSPVNVGEGCRFAGRCPKVMDKCRTVTPKLLPLKEVTGREVACHLY